MEIIIFLLCIAAAGAGFVVGYFIKKKVNIQINNKVFEEEQKTLDEYYKKINDASKEFNTLKEKTEEATKSFNSLTEVLKEAQDRELKLYHDSELDKIKRSIVKADEELKRNYENNKNNYAAELKKLESELNEFKSARKAIIEEQKRQEELETKKNFYMLQINENDKEDIRQLKTIEYLLHNKDVLNKLIFETYYKKPMTDMFGRIAGNNKPCGIYKITNTKNKKAYIGKSVEIIPKRWTEHIKTSLNIGSISRTKIHEAMKEYGIENFTFEILEECPKEKLNEREKYWIAFYETNTYGYNIKSGG